ncbi:MAG: thioredoxin family protein, partial [Bacteroidota bacterium]
TNGGRAIPVVIAIEHGKELWKWGPRPVKAQEMVNEFKQFPDRSFEELKTTLHTWYAKNKTLDQQQELIKLF